MLFRVFTIILTTILFNSSFLNAQIFGNSVIIPTNANGLEDINMADFDNDGDFDLIITSVNMDKIAWYQNDGTGTFGNEIVVTSNINSPKSVLPIDINNDNLIDILTVSSGSAQGNRGLFWFQNNGDMTFGTATSLDDNQYSTGALHAVDIDNDGDMDFLSTNNEEGLQLFINNGSGTFAKQLLNSSLGADVRSITSDDLNNDGFQDILVATYGPTFEVMWFFNDGNGVLGNANAIGEETTSAYTHVATGDLNGDGFKDLIASYGFLDKINWFANDGTGGFTLGGSVDNSMEEPKESIATDLDNDGDIDIITVGDNRTNWFENDGQGSFLESQVGFFPNGHSLIFKDVDGDNSKDLVIGIGDDFFFEDDKVVWFKNITIPSSTFQPTEKFDAIYPNPTEEFIYLNHAKYPAEFKIFNINSQLILTGDIMNENDEIYVGDLPSGMYFFHLDNKDNSNIMITKFLKN